MKLGEAVMNTFGNFLPPDKINQSCVDLGRSVSAYEILVFAQEATTDVSTAKSTAGSSSNVKRCV